MPAHHGIDFHPTYQDTNNTDWNAVIAYPLMSVKFSESTGVGRYEDRAVRDFLILRERKNQKLHKYIFAYHWLHSHDIAAQAKNFVRVVQRVGGFEVGESYQLDWEVTPDEPLATSIQAWEWITRVQDLLGVEGITYSADWLPDSTLDPDSRQEFLQWRDAHPTAPLWYANYNLGTTASGGLAEVARYGGDVWQWSDKVLVPGFTRLVDMNQIEQNGWSTLDRICRSPAEVQPPPPLPPVILPPYKDPKDVVYGIVPRVESGLTPEVWNNAGTEFRPEMECPIRRVAIHYTGSKRVYGTLVLEEAQEILRRIEQAATGVKENEYNYVVYKSDDGRVLEYAGLRQAAHSPGENDDTLAILLLCGGAVYDEAGNYVTTTERMDWTIEEKVKWLIAVLQALGAVSMDVEITKHRLLPGAATVCPGPAIEVDFDHLLVPWVDPNGPVSPPPPPPTTPTSEVVLTDMPTVRQGASGNAVLVLQGMLIQRGYNLTRDGQFGPQTNRVVRQYQTDKSLMVDGVVGPQTWGRLGRA